MSLDSVTEYALSFSGDAVHLLSRPNPTAGADVTRVPGWRHLGSVDFEESGFREALTRLRCMATGSGAESELPLTLVIPDDQILYTTLTVAPSADRERAVGQALDGLTPYPIADLAFDWHGDGDSVRVAAVARQTLREARDFAAEYGFRGVGYCADPQGGQFPGQPIFVLDPPERSRPALDPATVAVTAPALLVEADEAPAEAATETAADTTIPALPDEVAALRPAAADEDIAESGTPDTEAEDIAEAAPLPTEDLALPADATGDAEPKGDEAPSTPESVSDPAPADTPAPAEAALTASDPASDPAEPAPEDKTPEIAAGVAAAPVVRHAPARPETPKLVPRADAMNPRARALHDRAAETRQQRDPAPALGFGEMPAASGHRGGLASLLGMLALLVVGLVLIWAFAVPGDQTEQVVAVDEPAAATTDAAASGNAATTDTSTQTTAATDPAEAAADASVPADQMDSSLPSDSQLAAEDEALPEDGPMPQVKAVEEPVSALTEAEQRRVVIAAAAVAAAVVPPTATAALPADAAPTGSAAAQPATPGTVPPAASPATAATSVTGLARPTQPPARAQTSTPAAPTVQPGAQGTGQTTSHSPTQAAAIRAAVAEAAGDALTRSARPALSPRRSTPTTMVPRADSAPQLPASPQAYGSAAKSASARPPARRTAATPAATMPAVTTPAAAPASSAKRPPLRPEGSIPDTLGDAALDGAEQQQLDGLILDLRRHGLAQAAPDTSVRLADARPTRKPKHPETASDAVSASAVEAALKSATTSPPGKAADQPSASNKPARDSGGLLRGSTRPQSRPGAAKAAKTEAARPGAGSALSSAAVEEAIAAAVDASPATPGGVQLSVLRSSPLPPRRGDAAPASLVASPAGRTPSARAEAPADDAGDPPAAIPSTAAAAAAATPGPNETEMAARRALDEQLQAQAEARIRARAAADAAAEAQARAQAEARARAQAAAEERAAQASRQTYKPPEIDDEPELAGAGARGGVTAANVARSATQSRGIDMRRTTIIGIIGAGQASRALIRLRSGKVVTVRLGDRIDGGTINSIGEGRLTYVKAGQMRELRMLDGR